MDLCQYFSYFIVKLYIFLIDITWFLHNLQNKLNGNNHMQTDDNLSFLWPPQNIFALKEKKKKKKKKEVIGW